MTPAGHFWPGPATVSYHDAQPLPLELPQRPKSTGYVRAPRESQTFVPDYVAGLPAGGSGTHGR